MKRWVAIVLGLSMVAAANSSPIPVRIGNNFVFAPNGVSFIYQDRAGFVLDPGGDYFAGSASPDDSYHSTKFTVQGVPVVFEWSRVGDGMVGRFTSDRGVDLPLKLSQPWPGWKGSFKWDGRKWLGSTEVDDIPVWSLEAEHAKPSADGNPVLHLPPNGKARIAAGFGELLSPSSADARLDRSKSRFEAKVPNASGDWGDFLGAICNNLSNSRIYSNDDHRVAISVSRRWADGPNNAPYFCWDSFFNAALTSLNDPETARETVRAILSWQTPEGLVPNFGHWNFNSGRASNDRSQPPVGAMCVWKLQQRWPNAAFLAEVYPKLLKWHRWWPTARDGLHDGLLEWGSSAAGKQGALWETGWDDTVQYEGAEMHGSTLNAYAVDLNSLWAMDADYLASIAEALGKKSDASELRAEHARTIQLMDEKLWNPQLGLYCSRLWTGEFLTRITPMNFYPLLAGAINPDRADQILKKIKDPKKFWGDWILPTVAYDDPVWPQQDYWRGKVWAPVNFLVWQGLQQYADKATRDEFANKSVNLFMRNWKGQGVCGENYLSRDGTQSSDPHYTWGALLCLVGLENVCRIERDATVVLDGTQTRTLQIANVPIKGRLYNVRCEPGRTTLLSGKKVVAEATGKEERVRL